MNVFKFTPNRVLRLYHGGAGIDRLCGIHNPQDNQFPENWIASCIEGNGRSYHSAGHGISKVYYEGAILDFPEFLKANAYEILGAEHLKSFGAEPAVLAKILDSAERLPLQVHPTQDDARRHLGVNYGKTEAWIVLATRKIDGEEPYLLIGLNKKFDYKTFYDESVAGRYEQGLDMLHKLNVKTGDVFIIHGGIPHAIGPGVTMVEVMEPSDLVILPEKDCCGVKLDNEKRFNGLSINIGMSLFDFNIYSKKELLEYISPKSAILESNANGQLKSLIPYSACKHFAVEELMFENNWQLNVKHKTFRLGVLVEGNAKINDLKISQGESFMIPYSLDNVKITGRGKIIFILPPKQKEELIQC